MNSELPTGEGPRCDSNKVEWTVDDLKSFAGKACIDIFTDFSEKEIMRETTSVRLAWDIGRKLSDT